MWAGVGLPQRIVVKCEHLNPGGSVKDRITLAIVDDAEARGVLLAAMARHRVRPERFARCFVGQLAEPDGRCDLPGEVGPDRAELTGAKVTPAGHFPSASEHFHQPFNGHRQANHAPMIWPEAGRILTNNGNERPNTKP